MKNNENMQNYKSFESYWSKLENGVKIFDENFLCSKKEIDQKLGHSVLSPYRASSADRGRVMIRRPDWQVGKTDHFEITLYIWTAEVIFKKLLVSARKQIKHVF